MKEKSKRNGRHSPRPHVEETGKRQVQEKGVTFDVQRDLDVADWAVQAALDGQTYGSRHHHRHWGNGDLGDVHTGVRT